MNEVIVSGIYYTILNDNEAFIGTSNSSKDSNAVAGEFNPHLKFCERVEINGEKKLVTVVGIRAFRLCSAVVSIHIHRYIKKIDSYGFDYCTNCRKITFDKDSNLEILQNSAFYANKYTKLVIPKTVKQFSYACFGNNQNIISLTYMGTTNPDASINIFYNGQAPKSIYVGYDYPNETFHGIPVKRIANNNDPKCTCFIQKKQSITLLPLILSLIYS